MAAIFKLPKATFSFVPFFILLQPINNVKAAARDWGVV